MTRAHIPPWRWSRRSRRPSAWRPAVDVGGGRAGGGFQPRQRGQSGNRHEHGLRPGGLSYALESTCRDVVGRSYAAFGWVP
jgi:hypothetical protein